MVEKLLKQIEKCEREVNYEEQRGNYLNKLVHSYPTLTMPEEKELFKLYKTTGDRTYKDIIFKCNLKVVHDTCTDTTGLREDLISEGIVLLCEFIDHYDYTMPYMTFTQALKTRLTVLYNSKIIDNQKQLNTEMSTHELEEQEEEGKCLTDTNEIEPVAKQKHYILFIVSNEELFIEPKESLEIVPNPRLSKKDGEEIFGRVFDQHSKLLTNRPIRHSTPTDIDY